MAVTMTTFGAPLSEFLKCWGTIVSTNLYENEVTLKLNVYFISAQSICRTGSICSKHNELVKRSACYVFYHLINKYRNNLKYWDRWV